MIGDILSPTHLLFILVVALVFLGPKRLPEVGRSLGKSLRDFKTAMSGFEEQTNLMAPPPPPPPPPPAAGDFGFEGAGSAAAPGPAVPTVASPPEPRTEAITSAPRAAAPSFATAEPSAGAGAAVGRASGPVLVADPHEPAPSDYAD